MRIDVITLFPQLVKGVGEYGVIGRACQNGLLQLHTWNPRDDTDDRHRSVDDRPYGGGPGMVMKVAPLCRALARARAQAASQGWTICLSPQGEPLNHNIVSSLAEQRHLLLVAGRYEGIDERFIDLEVDQEISLGDYVLSGGELAAMVLVDAVARMIPGTLGALDSARQDSFVAGLLDHPHYTRPEVIADREVPQVLLTGNHEAVRRWRLQQALGRTWLRRPDLLAEQTLDQEQRVLLDEFIEQYSQISNIPD